MCCTALEALSSTSRVNDIDKQLWEEHVPRHQVSSSPPPPQPDMVLPSVHIVWRPLLEALKIGQLPVVENALSALARVTEAAGSDFLGRRFNTDVWPIFQRALGHDDRPSRKPLDLLLEEAPNAVLRLKVSVLNTIKILAGTSNSSKLFRGFVRPLVNAVVPYIGKSCAGALRKSATEVMLALAKVDADAVWFVLADICANSSYIDALPGKPEAMDLPNLEKLLPPLLDSHRSCTGVHTTSKQYDSYRLSKSVAVDCSDAAHSILERIGGEEVAWHNSILFSFKLPK